MYKNWNMFLTVLLLLLMEEIFPSGTKERRTSGGQRLFKMKPFHSRKKETTWEQERNGVTVYAFTLSLSLMTFVAFVKLWRVCRLIMFVGLRHLSLYGGLSVMYDVRPLMTFVGYDVVVMMFVVLIRLLLMMCVALLGLSLTMFVAL